ncbi:carboxypeptidase regulatory-like domain-containing protein [Lacinutrix salivirga]
MKTLKYIFGILSFLIFINCSEDKIDGDRIGTITGKVVQNGTNGPLENVKISTNPTSSTVFTDENGEFVLESIKVDEYSVQAELSGFVTAFESAVVIENETTNVAIELLLSNANNQPPQTPVLVFPEDLAEEVSLEVEFTWESSDVDTNDELTYVLELRNGTTNEVELFETEQDTFKIVSGLQLSTSYFWQVRVSDGINDEVSSSVSQFKTITAPNNPFIFVKKINGNNVIFSGNESNEDGAIDVDLLQLTEDSNNSFRPRANLITNKIAYLRTVGGDTNLFTMNFDGTNKTQITTTIPVAGFRSEELDFCWGNNGSKIFYTNFNRLYSVDPNGGGTTLLFQTTDGSFITEVATPDFDTDLVLLKTNNVNGYQVRIFTLRLSTGVEETVVVENQLGAYGGIDITANGNIIVYTDDLSDSMNTSYRQFQSRIFLFDVATLTSTQLDSDVILGENDLDPKFSPSEGALIFTRKLNFANAIPRVIKFQFGASTQETELFTEASMPDWD